MGRISLIDTPESISIVPFTKSAAKFHRVYIISTFKRSLLKLYEIDLYVNFKLRSIPTYKYNNTTTIHLKYFKFKG